MKRSLLSLGVVLATASMRGAPRSGGSCDTPSSWGGQRLGGPPQPEIARDATVSEEEIRSFYESNKTDPALAWLFRQPETVVAAQVLIAARRSLIERWLRDEGLRGPALAAGVVSEMTERRRLAESVRRRALAAADFAAVARQWSDDPGSREVGGDLGRFSRNIHPAAFDRVAFSLVPGQISPVIETEYGFHIIRVTSHEPERLLRLDELRATLHDRLQGRKR